MLRYNSQHKLDYDHDIPDNPNRINHNQRHDRTSVTTTKGNQPQRTHRHQQNQKRIQSYINLTLRSKLRYIETEIKNYSKNSTH